MLHILVAAAATGMMTHGDLPGEEHFERVIRPILATRCGACHGGETQWGELRLDHRAGAFRGGEHGVVLVAGDVEASRLISAVRREGDLAMPPDEPLPAAEVAALEAWVRAGAAWPDDGKAVADPRQAARGHWAFQPVRPVVPPAVVSDRWGDAAWARTPVDLFVAERLAAAGLAPAEPADRRTVIRRLSYGLTGLPPTVAEVDAFVADPAPDAVERLIDRLLESPAHAEHQARHWLDVARYSDTKGYVYAREHRIFVHAASYRDWVIGAFATDMPYDRFLVLQLAADQAAGDEPADAGAAAAMGFLTLGRRFLGVTHDIIDDRIDTVTRTTMGLTVACARCHDHKYDPIPTDDYYALYGVFASCTEELVRVASAPRDGPPPDGDAAAEAAAAFEAELATRTAALQDAIATRRREASARARARVGEYLAAQTDLASHPAEGFDQILAADDMIPTVVRRFELFLARPERAHDPVFAPWVAVSALAAEPFSVAAAAAVRSLRDTGPPLNRLVAAVLDPPVSSMGDMAARYGSLLADVERQWEGLVARAAAEGSSPPTAFDDPDLEQLRQVLHGPGSPCEVPDEPIVSIEGFFPSSVCDELWKLQGEVDRWLLEHPAAVPHAVRLVDRAELRTPRVFRRGDPKQPVRPVPRRFLTLVSGTASAPFTRGSGRLEMARAIVDPANPLTARVWVNRLWQQHFGTGLVDTPSDFGTRSSAPSHPELLDWLAGELVSSGWSTRHVQRLLLRSATYRQRSDAARDAAVAARAREIDPGNRLLWRMNPHRLGFEEFRDTLLKVSGRLDPAPGGRAADMFAGDGLENRRRSIYGLIDRQFLPTVLRVFDVANPDLHVPRRAETTVPQQALFALNHPFVADQARGVVTAASAAELPPEAAVRAVYRAILQREPSATQLARGISFLEPAPRDVAGPEPGTLTRLEQLAQVLLISNETFFID
jgi:cytochrome c553